MLIMCVGSYAFETTLVQIEMKEKIDIRDYIPSVIKNSIPLAWILLFFLQKGGSIRPDADISYFLHCTERNN
jgi:hypothetical protein